MSATTTTEPAVWIGCLACYNAGRLIGAWYPATEAGDVDVKAVHRGSGVNWRREGCEELWCLDIEGMPVQREMGPVEAQRWGEIYEEVGPEQWGALCAWVRSGAYTAEGDSDYPVIADFEEAFCGEWGSFRDYALDLADGIGLLRDVPEEISRHFGWDSWINDQEADYSVIDAPTGGVYVFRNM